MEISYMPECLTQINTVLWDLDGTLIDSEYIHDEAVVYACDKLNLKFDITTLAPGQDNIAVFELIIKDTLSSANEQLYNMWYKYVHRYTIDNFYKAGKIRQSVELVQEFAKLGIQQSIVSNTTIEVISQCIDSLNIRKYFTNLVGRDMVMNGKPDAEPYLTAIKKHKVTPEQCLVFEDSFTGIQAAKNAGINKIIGVGEHVYQLPINVDFICSHQESSWVQSIKSKYWL